MSKLILVLGIAVSLQPAMVIARALEFRSTLLIAGRGADSIVTGDFNGDRRLDIAVANRDADTISLFLGRGRGKFARARTFATGLNPRSLRAADVNGDGRLDLLTANLLSETVSVFLGTGRGSFLPRLDEPMCESCRPLSIEPGDFNRDSHVDIAVVFAGSNQVATLVGRGDGTFDFVDLAVVVRDDPQWLASGDFTRDGNVDLATANIDFVSVSTLHGNGDGTFNAGPEYATGASGVHLAVADVNGDALLDLAVVNMDLSNPDGRSFVSVFLGDGTGNFTPTSELEAQRRPLAVAIADFNRDGVPDIAVANHDSLVVAIFTGNGDGTFTHAVDLRTRSGPSGLATGDFNRDGVTDLAATNGDNATVVVFLSSRRR